MMIRMIVRQTKSENYLIDSGQWVQTYVNRDARVRCHHHCRIFVFVFLSAAYLYCVCSVYLGVGCDYAKYQILYLVNAKSHRSIHLLFMLGGEKGVVYLSSFCFISSPFYDRGINSNSQYDVER